jgi:hypothetical protein
MKKEEIDKLIKARCRENILLDCGDDGFIETGSYRFFRFMENGGNIQEYIKRDLAYKSTRRFKTLEEGLAYFERQEQEWEQGFEDLIENKRKNSKEPKKTEIVKSTKKSILLDRTISYFGYEMAVNPSKIEIRGPWNDAKKMIMNFVLLKMFEMKGVLKKDQLALYESRKEIRDYCEDMMIYKEKHPEIFNSLAIRMEIDPSELRERFNVQDRITNKEICKEALDIPGIYFVGQGRIYYDKKRRHFENVLFSHNLANVIIKETGKRERHTGEPRYRIAFQFYTELGVIIVANLLNAPVIKTLDTFYRLLPARREIYLSIRLKKSNPCHFTEQELLDLAGIKDKNPIRARESLANHLNKLKDGEWISNWKRGEGKYRYSYEIQK